MTAARFLIGIDLGTTNTAVAAVDSRAADPRVTRVELAQLVAPGELAARHQLPSFLYAAGEHDLAPAHTALPWDPAARLVVGELARSQGARVPGRMVASAKSWLCHAGVDRAAAILPWGEGDGPKLSPIDAQAAVLGHVRAAWDHAHAGDPSARFVDQELTVTVPASFDEAARELTLEAARRAGYPAVGLLEEPQAAFYAWAAAQGHGARTRLAPGATVLVFDIGGGTTDFTLIRVDPSGDGFERTAVGDHLLLGGDNIDLTLARLVEQRLADGKRLDTLQWHGLVHACRLAKETLLGDEPPAVVPIAIAARGARLVGGTLRAEVSRAELVAVLDDGFFPHVVADAEPHRQRGGLQEFGLPFAADPAVTRHLAGFLVRHGRPQIDAILFNGGAMTPASLRRRLLDQVAAWQGAAPVELANALPELAVAEGAAYFGLVRRGQGVRIRGGTPRAFYVGVGQARGQDGGDLAVCVAPKGLEDGSRTALARDFELTTNRPVSFRLFSSSSRADRPGDLVAIGDGTPDTTDDDSDLLELPPIVTVLRAPGRARATVRLEIQISELGALEVWCREADGDGAWRLSFDMRAGGAAARPDEDVADPRLLEARARLQAGFRGGAGPNGPAAIMKALEDLLGARRDEWTVATARGLFDAALEVERERGASAEHEARWLNLTGFLLRPGRGASLDDWRVKQMWRVFNEGLRFEKGEAGRLAWWILWRRIAGGLSKGQQEQLHDRLAQLFLPGLKQVKKLAEVKPTKEETAEMLRTLAHLERIDPAAKHRLGDEVLRRLVDSRKAREDGVSLWALGRIGARAPLYGPLNCVVAPSKAAAWLEALLALDWPEPDKLGFPMAQLGRRTGDRARDLDDDLRARLAARLRTLPGGDRPARLVEEIIALEAREERVLLGDTLPAGLRLIADA